MEVKGTPGKVNDNIIVVPPLAMPEVKGLGKMYYDKMVQYKDQIAQTDAQTGETETYASLLQRTTRIAITMRSKDIRPKDIISVCSHNSMDSFLPFYASLFMGAISANLDPGLTVVDTVHLLKQVRPKMIFVSPEAIKLIEAAVRELDLNTEIVVFGETVKYTKFAEFLQPSPEEKDFRPYEVEDPKQTAVIVFTSGSSGFPKSACLTHYGLEAIQHQMSAANLPHNAPVLAISSLYWISAVGLSQYFFMNGVNRIFIKSFKPAEVWDLIKKYKIVGLVLNSYHALEFIKSGRPEGADTSSVQALLLTGAVVSKEQILKVKECMPDVVTFNAYGQTESAGFNLVFNTSKMTDLQLLAKHPDSVGRPIPGYSYKIVDPETEEVLGPNQKGELRIKSDYYMSGYYNIDTSDHWDSDGFFKSGDIGFYNEDQCFFVVDRIKDLLKFRSWQVSPAKLETILLSHPAIRQAIVVGKPHPIDRDILTAVVALKESAQDTVTAEEIQKYVDDQVADYQRLRGGVRIVKELPFTITNKISRWKIKQYVIEGKI